FHFRTDGHIKCSPRGIKKNFVVVANRTVFKAHNTEFFTRGTLCGNEFSMDNNTGFKFKLSVFALKNSQIFKIFCGSPGQTLFKIFKISQRRAETMAMIIFSMSFEFIPANAELGGAFKTKENTTFIFFDVIHQLSGNLQTRVQLNS